MTDEEIVIKYFGGRPQYIGSKLYKIGDMRVDYIGSKLYKIGGARIDYIGDKRPYDHTCRPYMGKRQCRIIVGYSREIQYRIDKKLKQGNSGKYKIYSTCAGYSKAGIWKKLFLTMRSYGSIAGKKCK